MKDIRYQILEGKVAHELIDGEVIVLQFDTGFYYSLNDCAARLWQGTSEGASWSQILAAFDSPTAEQTAALEAFMERLVNDNLVTRISEATPSATAAIPKGSVRFEPPSMEKYGDMQDLLLSDPIHEVDEAGWPRPQAG
jgi:hypothetical protein